MINDPFSLFLYFTVISGLLFNRLYLKLHWSPAYMLAYPLGLSLLIVLGNLRHLLDLKAPLFGLMLASTLVMIVTNLKRVDLWLDRRLWNVFWLVPLAYLMNQVPGVLLSYDSVQQVSLGQAIGQAQGLPPELETMMASWALGLPYAQALLWELNGSFPNGIPISLLISHTALFFYVCYQRVRSAGMSAMDATGISCLITTTMFAVFFQLWQGLYFHNNSLAALLFFALWFLLTEIPTTEKSVAYSLFLSLALAVAFTRTETSIFVAMLVLIVLDSAKERRLAFQKPLLIFSLATLAWNLALLRSIGDGSDILNPKRIAIVATAPLAANLYLHCVYRFDFFKKIRGQAAWVIMITGLLGIGAYHQLASSEKIETSVASLIFNYDLYWGRAFWIALIISVFMFFRKKTIHARVALIYLLLLVLMSIFRVPYRPGWGDSANRISLHFFPLMVVAVCDFLLIFRSKVSEFINLNYHQWVKREI